VGELRHLAATEDVIHLDDLILRRTMIGKLGQITPDSLQEIARICAEALNWSQQKTVDEIDRITRLLQSVHKMDFNVFIEE
jgi:glycerol-3-phosphate dehydrogenase